MGTVFQFPQIKRSTLVIDAPISFQHTVFLFPRIDRAVRTEWYFEGEWEGSSFREGTMYYKNGTCETGIFQDDELVETIIGQAVKILNTHAGSLSIYPFTAIPDF